MDQLVLSQLADKPRILVIDDHHDSGELVRRVGEKVGFEVTVTTRADQFRNLCVSVAPQVICLDIVMPQEDGIELIRWLAQSGSKAAIYIITGHSPAYARAAVEIGRSQGLNIAGVLQKPVSLVILRDMLSAAQPASDLSPAAD